MANLGIPWLVATAACLCVGAVAFYRGGPGLGVGIGLAMACLVPTWVDLGIGDARLNVRHATAIALMAAYCFHPRGRIWSSLNMLDIAVAGLVIWHIVVDYTVDGFSSVLPIRAYLEWGLPYVSGRFAMMHAHSISKLAVWFTSVAILIGLAAVVESISQMNIWEIVFGHVRADDLIKRPQGLRFGLSFRAMGPTRHPILLGCVLVLLVPWAISLATTDGVRWRRILGWSGVVSIILGTFAAMSRGPLLALIVAAFVATSFYYVWARRLFPAIIIVGALATFLGWSSILEFIDRIENEKSSARVVEINGEFERYTSSRARILIFQLYGPLVFRGGITGFGTAALEPTPPNIPGLSISARDHQTLGVVENSYLTIALRFGMVGVSLFILLHVAAIATAFSLARKQSLVTYPAPPVFLVAIGSILVGMSFEMMTVLPVYDFYFWVLFMCGMVAGLAALDVKIRRGEVSID